MASYIKFQPFVENLAKKQIDLSGNGLTVALSNSDPGVSAGKLSEVSQISYTYCSSRVLTVDSCTQTNGTLKLILQDLTLTASGGSVGPFRYIIIYDDNSTDDNLICYYDYGSSITLADGESLLLDFDGTDGLLQLT